jgi:hypothetical protein
MLRLMLMLTDELISSNATSTQEERNFDEKKKEAKTEARATEAYLENVYCHASIHRIYKFRVEDSEARVLDLRMKIFVPQYSSIAVLGICVVQYIRYPQAHTRTKEDSKVNTNTNIIIDLGLSLLFIFFMASV